MKEGYGVCPVCNGTMQVVLTEKEKSYSWNKDKTHRDCHNCGGQYQWGSPKGEVRLRKDNNEPCVHSYIQKNLGRCYNGYTCVHCDDYYTVDSSD
jgi:hypothetical protein